jgi:hypothetical protein
LIELKGVMGLVELLPTKEVTFGKKHSFSFDNDGKGTRRFVNLPAWWLS